jgi:hypothetical protein
MTAPAGGAGEVPQVELRRPSHAEDITPEDCAGSLGTMRRLQMGGKDCTILPAALELGHAESSRGDGNAEGRQR